MTLHTLRAFDTAERPHFQSIILRRERAGAGEPFTVTGVTVRYADGIKESVDCCEDRVGTIATIEGFIFAPLQEFELCMHSNVRVWARDISEAYAIARAHGVLQP